MRHLLVFCFALVLGLVGCTNDETDLGSAQQGMGGMDPGPVSGVDSPAQDPVVTVLGEYKVPEMRNPTRIAVTSIGDIIVTDPRARKVFILNESGALKRAISDMNRPIGVAVGAQDRIYVGDETTGSVRVYDEAGNFLSTLGNGVGEFAQPSDLAWDRSTDRIYVSDSRGDAVKVYAGSGRFLFAFGGTGFGQGQFKFPTGVTVDDASRRLFVVDHTNARIQIFDLDGNYISGFGSYGPEKAQLIRPQGAIIDQRGRFYVTDAFQGQVQVLDSDGLHVSYVGDYGTGPRQLSLPVDAAIDQRNRLLVTSYSTGKVVVYGIDTYTEPARTMLADTFIDPPAFNIYSRGMTVTAYIEVPFASADAIVPTSLQIGGVSIARSVQPEVGDVDGDGVPDLKVELSRLDVLAKLPGHGEHALEVDGVLDNGDKITGDAIVQVLPSGPSHL